MSPEAGELTAGQELARDWKVEERHLYNPSGKVGHEVLSSPSMIWEMETTCADLAKAKLSSDLTTVGYHVDVKHVAPARQGASITTSARLTEVNGNKLTFFVKAIEGGRLVGAGRHRRAVISVSDLD